MKILFLGEKKQTDQSTYLSFSVCGRVCVCVCFEMNLTHFDLDIFTLTLILQILCDGSVREGIQSLQQSKIAFYVYD